MVKDSTSKIERKTFKTIFMIHYLLLSLILILLNLKINNKA